MHLLNMESDVLSPSAIGVELKPNPTELPETHVFVPWARLGVICTGDKLKCVILVIDRSRAGSAFLGPRLKEMHPLDMENTTLSSNTTGLRLNPLWNLKFRHR